MAGWKTSGSKILNEQGQIVHFNGLSWFGLESSIYVLHGLWQRPMDAMLDQIQSLGYNLLRIPYSNDMLTKGADAPMSIDYSQNPDLKGLSPLEILDLFIDKAAKRNIYIMLDRHLYAPGGNNGDHWVSWDQGIGEDKWISDWVMLANRYKDKPNMFGADLANEPHTQAVTWQNWVAAAEKCGNAILEAAPNWLIVVEGIEVYNNNWYWWGGQLEGVKDLQVQLTTPNKVVYSPHEYGPGVYSQSWFQAADFPDNLPAIWDAHFGYIAKQNIAPVLVGEFGGKETDTNTTEGKWQNAFVDYIKANDLCFTYWCLNPDSGDTGGILEDDWVTVNKDKQTMLQRLFQPYTQSENTPTTQPTTQPTTPAETPASNPTPATTVVTTNSTPAPGITPSTKPESNPSTPAVKPSTPPTTQPPQQQPTPVATKQVETVTVTLGEAMILALLLTLIGLASGAFSVWFALTVR